MISNRAVNIVAWSYTILIFIYLALRSAWVEPLHDELGTFFFYFVKGDFWGANIEVDANNHLLNSFLGNVIYRLFDSDNWFLLRLPNLLSFPIYAFGLFKILERLQQNSIRIVGFIALLSIPFVLEYFAFARGYGISMGFLPLGIHFLISYFEKSNLRSLIFGLGAFLIAVSANLTLINLCLLTVIFVLFNAFWKKEKIGKVIGISVGFLLFLAPFIGFALKLKGAGALYYGSLDGIWDLTGRSLIEYTLFDKSNYWMGLFALLILALAWLFILKIKKETISNLLQQPFSFLLYLLMGSLLGSIFLAEVMGVNYPEDRAGMYLIPFFLLTVIFALDNFQWGRYSSTILLFFPIVFIGKINFDTSVITPDQRTHDEFIQKVRSALSPTDNLMVYNTAYWAWAYADGKAKKMLSSPNQYQEEVAINDVILTKSDRIIDPKTFEDYEVIAENPFNNQIAFKRKKPLQKVEAQSNKIDELWGRNEFYDIAKLKVGSNDNFQVTLTGKMKTNDHHHHFIMVAVGTDDKGNTIQYEYYPFANFYFGRAIEDEFRLNFVIENKENVKEVSAYLWNKSLSPFNMSNVECKFYKIQSD